jgi:hypothetical protein
MPPKDPEMKIGEGFIKGQVDESSTVLMKASASPETLDEGKNA